MSNPASQPELTITIDGRELPTDEVLNAELQRGLAALGLLGSACGVEAVETAAQRFAEARSLTLGDAVALQRTALVELKQRLGRARIQEALEPYTQATQKQMQEWGLTPGEFAKALVEVTVAGMSAKQFIGWFHRRSAQDDEVAMISSNPDHFLIAPIADPSGQDVIETMGLYGGPLHVILTFHADPAVYPEAALADHPIRLCATGAFAGDRTDVGAKALHQFKDTADGMHAQLGIYFPTSFPEALVKGHQMHLAIEFRNWILAARAAAS
jgi:hypothetical protein